MVMLSDILRIEKLSQVKGGVYHKLQVEMTYNSNRIEGCMLTCDQVRYIYETNTIGTETSWVNVNDIVETVNHFCCINSVISDMTKPLSEDIIKKLHSMLKNGTSDSRQEWFAVGDYKKRPNEVGGCETTKPECVSKELSQLIASYNRKQTITFDDIIDFHYAFEKIHPFQDGNGRVGRLLILKECLKHNIVPIMLDESLKMFYCRGLAEYEREKGFLLDTCLSAQDKVKQYLDYFEIGYED